MSLIYLAGPIDAAVKGGQNWKQLFQHALEDHSDPLDQQWTAYDPAAPWILFNDLSHEPYRCAWIETVNRTVIKHCDIVVAYQPSIIMTIGTPIELADADDQRKIIIVFSDVEFGKAVYLQNRVERDNFFYIKDYLNMKDVVDTVAKRCIEIATDLSKADGWDVHKRYEGHAEALFARARRNAPRGPKPDRKLDDIKS